MSRLLRVALLIVLAAPLIGGSCDDEEAVGLEELRADVEPAFGYSLYCDDSGKLVGERSGVLLVHRSAHLERVYADAQAGDARARALFEQLEQTLHRSGGVLAKRASGMVCHAAPACTVQWHFLDELMPSRGPGGMRLREQLADSFSRQAKIEGVRNAIVAGALTVLLATTVVKGEAPGAASAEASAAEARATAAEAGRLALGGVEARLAVEEAAALEARLVEAEALEVGARHPAKLEVLGRYRPSATEPPSGVAADNPRWTSYVAYWTRRYEELAGARPLARGQAEVKPPLTWENYSPFLGRFQQALEFQQSVSRFLRQGAPAAERDWGWLHRMKQRRADGNVGLKREGSPSVVYVDDLVVDEATLRPGLKPDVHVVSTKRHDFLNKSHREAGTQLEQDVAEATTKYGGTVEVRRPGHPLFGRKVDISRVHLVYDGRNVSVELKDSLSREALRSNVSLHFHDL
jgi:hypothetical protein